MPITLGNARSDLRDRLNEASANFFDDAWLNTMLNEGARDMARRARALMGQKTIPIFGQDPLYAAPPDFWEFHRAEYLPTGSINVYVLRFRNYDEMDAIWGVNQTIQQNYPEFITLWREPPNTNFVLFPVPSTAGVMRLQYFRIPTAADVDTDNLDVTEGYWDLAIAYALYKALFKALDPRWKDARGEYEEKLLDLAATAAGYTDAVGSISYGAPTAPVWQFGAFGAWE